MIDFGLLLKKTYPKKVLFYTTKKDIKQDLQDKNQIKSMMLEKGKPNNYKK